MATSERMLSKYSTFILIFFLIVPLYHAYFIEEITPSDCKSGTDDEYHEYFDISQLRCLRCSQASTLQTVSSDGLGCQCRPGYRLTKDFGGGAITCAPCPANQVTSADGWECVECETGLNAVTSECQPCEQGVIAVERSLDGSWGFNEETRQCYSCDENTTPNAAGDRCIRCSQVLSVIPTQTDCNCPANQEAGGLCFSDSADLPDDNAELYRVTFGDNTFGSAFFYQNIRAAKGMCLTKYGNLTACQMLGNMCVMRQYDQGNNDACTLYVEQAGDGDNGWRRDKGVQFSQHKFGAIMRDSGSANATAILANATGSTSSKNKLKFTYKHIPANMPWLYYEDRGDIVLSDEDLTQTYTFPDSKLDFVVAKYTVDGTYLGMSDVLNGELQLCKNSETILDAAYDFGTTYTQSCELNVASFFNEDRYETIFYDMFLKYKKDGFDALYPIPVYLGSNPDEEDKSQWEFVRRFFLVDNVSGKEYTDSSGENEAGETTTTRRFAETAKAVRYAANMKIHVSLKEGATDGSIVPPFLSIQYATASSSDRDNKKKVTITFDVSYSMSLDKYRQDLRIAVGVLSALAIIYAAVQTWGWSKRDGRIGIDFPTLLMYLIFLLAALSNVFLVVAFGSAIWWFVFYKQQKAVYLIVPEDSEEFVAYLATAFTLKAIALIHMIYVQVRVDIFFIDWERPKAKSGDGGEVPVSIWRSYFAANEWNEMQTMRKINPRVQIFIVALVLYVFGFENMAVMSPSSALGYSDNDYKPPMSKIFRFAVGGLCYLVIALVQWIFHTFIKERFWEDKMRQYTDFCSISNISVFILENNLFGYYIHGRSPHGRADTNLSQMHEDFKREEENMCGTRGLTPNSEQQTFEIAVPRKLREQYNRVMMPILQRQQGAQAQALRGQAGSQSNHLDAHTERCITAYTIINRFLQNFVDHSLRDIDYIIEDKLLLESILRVEFKDGLEKGFLYNDSGHSFDQILFFGNEALLTMFDLLLFSVMDLAFESFVLAAFITWLVGELIASIRDGLGRKNLAAKTLVDDRFLI